MSSESSSSSEQPQAKPEKPLFSSDPIEFIRIESELEDGQPHVFIVDKDAIVRYSKTIESLVNIQSEMSSMMPSSSGTTLSDDAETSSPGPVVAEYPLEFREIPQRAMENVMDFCYWKKRWANVVTERIPDFNRATEKNLALHVLVAANELRV